MPRRERFQTAHPEVEIVYYGPRWQAVIPDGRSGETVVTRYNLRQLLDKLEELTADDGKPSAKASGSAGYRKRPGPLARPGADQPRPRPVPVGPIPFYR